MRLRARSSADWMAAESARRALSGVCTARPSTEINWRNSSRLCTGAWLSAPKLYSDTISRTRRRESAPAAADSLRGRKRDGGSVARCSSVSWVRILGAFCCRTSASSETRARILLREGCAKAGTISKTNPKKAGAEAILNILLRPGKFWRKDKLFIFLRFQVFLGFG